MKSISQHNSLINGEWVAASACAPNLTPSTLSDVVGEYAQADLARLNTAVAAAQKLVDAAAKKLEKATAAADKGRAKIAAQLAALEPAEAPV